MSDSVGSCIDKLLTCDLKMWHGQEGLYEIRRMEFTAFWEKHLSTIDKMKELHAIITRCCDLNVQRNALINEIDEKIIALISQARTGADLDDGKNIQRAHKTY